jgi:hypothetical protein
MGREAFGKCAFYSCLGHFSVLFNRIKCKVRDLLGEMERSVSTGVLHKKRRGPSWWHAIDEAVDVSDEVTW